MPRPARGYSIRLSHITANVPKQPDVSRSFALSIIATNHVVEVSDNHLTCESGAAACQAVMCYRTADCKMHHNFVEMNTNTTKADGRALLFDRAENGEAWNNTILVNNNRAVRVRDSFHVRIHDNQFRQIAANGAAAVHLADPDAGTNDLDVLVDGNTFEVIDGTAIFIRNGVNATVRNNTISCADGCSRLGRLFSIRSPIGAGNRTEITIENNPTAALNPASPPIAVGLGARVNSCNSGSATGKGEIIPSCK
jgi:hypothetical protein